MYMGQVARKMSWKKTALRRRPFKGVGLDFGGLFGGLLQSAPTIATDYFKIQAMKDQASAATQQLVQQRELVEAQARLVALERAEAPAGAMGYDIPWIPIALVGAGGVVLFLVMRRRKRR